MSFIYFELWNYSFCTYLPLIKFPYLRWCVIMRFTSISIDSRAQGPYSDQNKLLYQVWQYFNARTKYLEILKGGSIWAPCETNI